MAACWPTRQESCDHEEVPDPVTEVLDARAAYDQARIDARELVDRARAMLGKKIHDARQTGTSQTAILVAMGKSREQIRA